MNFRSLAVRNLKLNTQKYAAYFLSSTFCIMTFFLYTVLILNDGTFSMGNYLSISIVTSIIISVFINFSVFFIGYAYTTFIKSRGQEFGLYLTHGMTNRQLKRMVWQENLIINLSALMAGLIAGTIFSKIFFLVVIKVSRVEGVSYSIGLRNYIVTAAVFSLIYLFLGFYTHVKLGRMQARELLKVKKAYVISKLNTVLGMVGLLLIAGSWITLYIHKASRSMVTYREIGGICINISMIGLYLLLFGFGSLYSWLSGINKWRYMKKVLTISQINYRFSRNKNIIFLLSVLGFIMVYYSGYGYSLSDKKERFNSQFNYDILYIGDYGKDDTITKIHNVIEKSGAGLKAEKEASYFELSLSKEEATKERVELEGTTGVISQSQFKNITGFELSVGRGHSFVYPNAAKVKKLRWKRDNRVILSRGNKNYTYSIIRTPFALALTEDNAVPDYVVILSDDDFDKLAKDMGSESKKLIYGFTFHNPDKAPEVIKELEGQLAYGKEKLISKYNIYDIGGVDEDFSRFMFIFTEILLFIISGFILYFNLIVEMDEVKSLYKSLFRMGITDEEMKKIVYSELGMVFYMPLIISSILGSTYIWIVTLNEPDRMQFIMNTLWTVLWYILFCSIFYFIARRRFVREVVEDIQL